MTVKDDIVLELETRTGPMRTYLFRPTAEGKYPGVVFFSEIFQVTGPIRRTAAMIAGHGYMVAVPEVYHELEPAGAVLAYDQQGADQGNADKFNKELPSYDTDARARSKANCCTSGAARIRTCLSKEEIESRLVWKRWARSINGSR